MNVTLQTGFPRVLVSLTLLVSILSTLKNAPATTLVLDAGFSGFQEGDVYFVSSIEFSSTIADRPLTLFRYSPVDDAIYEVLSLEAPNFLNGDLAYDSLGRGLWIGTLTELELLEPDGNLADVVLGPPVTLLDVSASMYGAVYVAESNRIMELLPSGLQEVVNLGVTIRGLAALPGGGFATGVGVVPGGPYGIDNFLFLDASGVVQSQHRIGQASAAGIVRARNDGTVVAVSNQRTTLNLVQPDGSYAPFANDADGIFQTDGLAIDQDGDAWVTTRGRPASLQEFSVTGTLLTSIPLELTDLLSVPDRGFFSPSGVAVIVAPPPPNLDVDANGGTDALTDGILILRFLFGFAGETLTAGQVTAMDCKRCQPDVIRAFLQGLSLDVDGNGQKDALTDGILVLRFLFGFTGEALVDSGVVAPDCTRCTAEEIEMFLKALLPS